MYLHFLLQIIEIVAVIPEAYNRMIGACYAFCICSNMSWNTNSKHRITGDNPSFGHLDEEISSSECGTSE